jgi:hypothetical protein
MTAIRLPTANASTLRFGPQKYIDINRLPDGKVKFQAMTDWFKDGATMYLEKDEAIELASELRRVAEGGIAP